MLQYQSILPESKIILNCLMSCPELSHFRLVGGMALVLLKGHRMSHRIDLAAARNDDINPEAIVNAISAFFPNSASINILQSSDSIIVKDLSHGIEINISTLDAEEFIHVPLIIDNIRMASLEDLSAIALKEICSRFNKTDFVDSDQLLVDYSMGEMIAHYQGLYPFFDKTDPIFALAQVDRAEHGSMPQMLNGRAWEEIKLNIKTAFREFMDVEIESIT